MNKTKNIEKYGILLINIGTPESPACKDVTRYLRSFLSDKRIINLPSVLRYILLNCIILPNRAKKSAKKYSKIWTDQGSPLLLHSKEQANLLQKRLISEKNHNTLVAIAMRHSKPSINQVIQELIQQNITCLMFIPLFPQYSSASSASAFDEVFRTLQELNYPPKIISINSFHNHSAYIDALAKNIMKNWEYNGRGEKLLISFHSLPLKNIQNGEVYLQQCKDSAQLLANSLNLKAEQWQISFQSRFGKQKWLSPFSADVLHELGTQQLKQLDVICPGFVSDCLETLEEINIIGKKQFQTAGGGKFNYIPCLNTSEHWINALSQIINENLPHKT